jgi:hypothetical protein
MGFHKARDPNRPKLGQRIRSFFQRAGHTLGKVLQNPIVQALTAPLAFLGPIGMAASAGLNIAGAGLSMIHDPNPDAISQAENEDKLMEEAMANDLAINSTQTSNIQRLNQACNVGSNLDNSEQYNRYETQGTRTKRADSKVLSVANMHSSTNSRAAHSFQTKSSETKVAKTYRLQSGKLSELQNIENSPMSKNMDPSLGYHISQSMTEI